MNEQECYLFLAIAQAGIDAGKEISIEKKRWESKSTTLGGAILDSNTQDNGVILRVFDPVDLEGEEDTE